jgi:hypothetical protein
MTMFYYSKKDSLPTLMVTRIHVYILEGYLIV